MTPLREQAALLPLTPGVYLYKDGAGKVIYVGKAKSLRARVRSYFNEDRLLEAKTGTLISEAHSVDYILVDNEKEALALENNLIKQYRPRFNVLLRDDKTYPYIKLTNERYPRVYVTRRLRKDGSTYYGPYFPGNLAYRIVHLIHRHFLVPSCKVDLTRFHPKPCLQFHIHRCLGPCVEGLTTNEEYARAARQVKMLLEGRHTSLAAELRDQMEAAAENLRFERAAALRDILNTVEEIAERQKMAAAAGNDADIFGYYAEPPMVAVNVFHMRNGQIVDRREFFWEDQREFSAPEFFSSLLLQIYLDQQFVPSAIHVPVEFEDCAVMEELLSEKKNRRVEVVTPQRGQKKAMLSLAETNAKHSFEARFRVMKPSSAAIKEALQDALSLGEAPHRIECFDISHVQGTDKVASMVVWEDGRMKKSDYRKFIIRTVEGNDDFASMREVVTRRYARLQAEGTPLPGLVLIDGGLGQLHAAADALAALGIGDAQVASIAKREEIIYVLGQEDEPVVLDRFSPILHLIQTIRDEAHRFAVTFHRTRRNARTLTSELENIPGVGDITVRKLLREFGSSTMVRQSSEHELAKKIGKAAARRVRAYYDQAASLLP
ncbi:MAG TPA: excinuclease ABC subunit UvrC [Bryobacteraceae bacterium]|nr:excinuclease ABC subunit UvrC [Bryobacteraceae bacterium]